MATLENNSMIMTKDGSDNRVIHYPVTKIENVIGMDEAMQTIDALTKRVNDLEKRLSGMPEKVWWISAE